MYCIGSFEHNNYTGTGCEIMRGNSCGGKEKYVGEWEGREKEKW